MKYIISREQLRDNFYSGIKNLLGKDCWDRKTELSRIMGVSRPSVHEMVRGRYLPTVGTLRKVSSLFSVSTDYLLGIPYYYCCYSTEKECSKYQLDTIGKRLTFLLKIKSIHPFELSFRSGVTPSTVWSSCSDIYTPKVVTVANLASVLEVSTDYIIGV